MFTKGINFFANMQLKLLDRLHGRGHVSAKVNRWQLEKSARNQQGNTHLQILSN